MNPESWPPHLYFRLICSGLPLVTDSHKRATWNRACEGVFSPLHTHSSLGRCSFQSCFLFSESKHSIWVRDASIWAALNDGRLSRLCLLWTLGFVVHPGQIVKEIGAWQSPLSLCTVWCSHLLITPPECPSVLRWSWQMRPLILQKPAAVLELDILILSSK